MVSGRPLPVVLLVLVAFLAPLLTSPVLPDPIWRGGGVFDAGKGDEVSALVWDEAGAVAPLRLLSPGAPVTVQPMLAVLSVWRPSGASDSRAPPVP